MAKSLYKGNKKFYICNPKRSRVHQIFSQEINLKSFFDKRLVVIKKRYIFAALLEEKGIYFEEKDKLEKFFLKYFQIRFGQNKNSLYICIRFQKYQLEELVWG